MEQNKRNQESEQSQSPIKEAVERIKMQNQAADSIPEPIQTERLEPNRDSPSDNRYIGDERKYYPNGIPTPQPSGYEKQQAESMRIANEQNQRMFEMQRPVRQWQANQAKIKNTMYHGAGHVVREMRGSPIATKVLAITTFGLGAVVLNSKYGGEKGLNPYFVGTIGAIIGGTLAHIGHKAFLHWANGEATRHNLQYRI